MPHQQNQSYTRSHSVGKGSQLPQLNSHEKSLPKVDGAKESAGATGALPSKKGPAVPRINRKAHSSSSLSNSRDAAESDADALLVSEARRLSVSAGIGTVAAGISAGEINATDESGFSRNSEKQQSLGQSRPTTQQQPNHVNHLSKLDLDKIDTPRRFQNQRRSSHQKPQNFHSMQGTINYKNTSNMALYQQQELRRVPSHTSATATNPILTSSSPFKTPSKSSGVIQQYPLARSTSSTLSRNSSSSLHSSSINNMATPSRPPRSHNSFSSLRHSSHQSYSSSSSTVKRFAGNTNKSSSSSNKQSKRKFKVSKPDPKKFQNYTFQHPSHAMRVSVRNVDLANRVAFETRLGNIGFGVGADTSIGGIANSHADYGGVLNSNMLKNMLLEMERVRSTSSVVSSSSSRGLLGDSGIEKRKRSENPCRISPSPNHLAILEFLYGTGSPFSTQGGNVAGKKRVVRQLQWNAACSVDADPWFDSLCDKDEIDAIKRENDSAVNKSHEASLSSQCNRYLRNRKLSSLKSQLHGIEGRYIPINPLSDTKANLPNHSPLLTNYKRRLPMRSDVGFANPTEKEISLKMEECKKESEWEESSPRIVLMASGFPSFHYKSSAQNDCNHEEEDDHFPMVDELHPSCREDAKLWAGGSIPGLPFAGRDLVMAYKMSSKWFGGCKDIKVDQPSQSSQHSGAYSMFAPPVDATFSSSHLWRPRPFMDRPPGFVYFLACPLDVRFKVGDIEPLYCTMALYTLPTSSEGRGRPHDEYDNRGTPDKSFSGKISEDFFFPAGDWDSLDDDRTVTIDGDNDDEQQAWRRRKRRAIMAYDPLDISPGSLHLVFQVFIVTRTNALGRYLQSTTHENVAVEKDDTASRKNSILEKLKRPSLLSRGKSNESPRSNEVYPTAMKEDTQGVIEAGAANFLTPLCFSVVPAFPSPRFPENQHWPLGASICAPFYSFPEVPESQEDFTKRLTNLVQRQELNVVSDPQNKSRSCYRLDHSSSQQSSGKLDSVTVEGRIDVFTSFLGGDFTRSLLEEPSELSDTAYDAASLGPQLLADVMGDCAISFDGTSIGDINKKRSRLRRLPPSPDSGYSSSFDLKEVLFFPPRSAPRKYDDDVPLCSSTVINLLYVYPKLIRSLSDGTIDHSKNQNDRLSLRIRLVEQELTHHEQSFDSTDGVYEPMSAIYNPVSQSGPPLVESFLTKLSAFPLIFSPSGAKSSSKPKVNKSELFLNDEIKVRLPQVLDRRHFIQFTLLSVNISTHKVNTIAETTVPLVISSKETTSRGRVTTVIPNGLHRIQLGEEYQVHIETRLASSLHISDPSVATILRDYPLSAGCDSRDVVIHKPSGVPYLDILSMASGQAVRRHFLSLITANMINFVNETCPPFYFESLYDIFGSGSEWHRLVAWENTDSLVAIIRSLIDILDKTRTSFLEKEHSIISLVHQRMLKSFLDFFDESLFSHHHSPFNDADYFNPTDEKKLDDSIEGSTWHSGAVFDEANVATGDPFLSANPSFDNRRTKMQKYRFRSPRNHTEQIPFSRRAFIATRTEQLKAEAEMYDENLYTNQYFDDDETVMTFGTITSRSVFPVVLETRNSTLENLDNDSPTMSSTKARSSFQTSPETAPSNRSSTSTEPFSFTSTPAKFMANRVNNVAQLVIAPCMAPSLSDVISCGVNASPRHQMNSSSANGRNTGDHILPNAEFPSGKSPFEPSSDVEDEEVASGITGQHLVLRGNHSCFDLPRLILHPMRNNLTSSTNNDDESMESNSQKTYLYEALIVLWVQSWTAVASSIDHCERQLKGLSKAIPVWPFEIILGINNPSTDEVVAFSFVRHLAFFLPLCFKSLVLRCTNRETSRLLIPMTFLDDSHMQILIPIVETTALGIMREALSGSGSASNADQMITKALSISDVICDFFAGLLAILHPSQMRTLLLSYFNILHECESQNESNRNRTINFQTNLRVIKCVRQIILHAVERLASMPRFLSLNFPIKYTGTYPKYSGEKSTWCSQHQDVESGSDLQSMMIEVDRDPPCFWLAEILMDECFNICQRSCEAIIIEAQTQSKAARRGRKVDDQLSLSRNDLLRLESIAYHSIICVYELLIKRHAMDSRFQNIACNTRVAGMFVSSVLEHVVNAASVLATMEGSHRVRCLWLLSLVYILQEGPEVLIRNKLREFCKPTGNRVNDFIAILKMSSITFQYLIPNVKNDELLHIIGGMTKEFIQETFNCLAASVILLIDECFDIISCDDKALESSAAAVFDLLLHMLSSPQSSVTLLRTLGGSAHSLDRFGARVFLAATGHRFQHWGRIILSLMNSTELSVRSMAVDFFVSLIGGAFNDIGSIDAEMTCILSVMPEVVAREIALYNVSGLLHTMDDVESCLWPLRRALADVEDTNPLDDDRIDPQMMPSIRTLCRTGQAIIDGVFIEMRLCCSGTLDLEKIKIAQQQAFEARSRCNGTGVNEIFDADEESLFEATNYFSSEGSLSQKLRWLLTLRDLHVAKNQWLEAAEALVHCARAVIESFYFIVNHWRPSQFDLWNDYRRSPWISSIRLSQGPRNHDNMAVMEFAKSFLEPGIGLPSRPSMDDLCSLFDNLVEDTLSAYTKEDGSEELAYAQFEELLSIVSDEIKSNTQKNRHDLLSPLRRVRATICTKISSLTIHGSCKSFSGVSQCYVRVILSGEKPDRFKESTTIPTFLEWSVASICRVTQATLSKAEHIMKENPLLSDEECICLAYAEPFVKSLRKTNNDHDSIVLRTSGNYNDLHTESGKTYIDVRVVQMRGIAKYPGGTRCFKSRRFYLRCDGPSRPSSKKVDITEFTVANRFPHVTSRQRNLITSEIKQYLS